MANNLIIVPIHPPHFHWATNLLDSASSSENIALGFSNQDDANSFHHTFPFKPLIYNVSNEYDEGEFITKKKLNLLKQVYTDYDYISIIDAESKFLKPVTNCLEEIWNNNSFIANHSVDGAKIMKGISESCGYSYNDDLYPWFNCMPIYKSDLLPDFFNWLNSHKAALKCYGAFDFLIFATYCRYELNIPWRVLDGHAWHGLVENKEYWAQYPHLINQVPWSTYQKGIEKHSNIKMLFHLDRIPIK